MELVEQSIRAIEKRLSDNLSSQVKAVELINDSDHIQKYVAKIIERANDSLLPDSTTSLNELFGKALASNLISETLKNVIGTFSAEALSKAIQEATNAMCLTISSAIMNDMKDVIKDMEALEVMTKFNELKITIELMKSNFPLPISHRYNAAKIWNEMKNLGNDVPFTVFVIGKGDKFDHVTIIPDQQLEVWLGDLLFAPFVNDVIKSFVQIGTLKNTNQPPKPNRNSLNVSNSNEETTKTTGFAFYRSGCVLQALGNKFVYSSGDQCLSSHLINNSVRIWMNFWKDFFKQDWFHCGIQGTQSHQIGISGGLVDLVDHDSNHWYVVPLCEGHKSSDYALGGIKAPMKTVEATISIKIPTKSKIFKQVSNTSISTGGEKKIFTEKDFETETFCDQKCLLKIPLNTHGIGTTSMEYKWKVGGK